MSIGIPEWWDGLRPWRALNPLLPIGNRRGPAVTGIVVHSQGRFGRNKGNWVAGDSQGHARHFGLDIIGWMGDDGPHPLETLTVCRSPIDGVVAWVGADEHGHTSINMRHSPRNAERRRFSFFGDLERVYVKTGQRVSAGTWLGMPCLFRKGCRFFHFAMGYEVKRNGKWHDIFIDPGAALRAKIMLRPELPWRERARWRPVK